MSFATLAIYWHEKYRQPVLVVTSPSPRIVGSDRIPDADRRAHGACVIYGEGLMYGRDNMGIGLR